MDKFFSGAEQCGEPQEYNPHGSGAHAALGCNRNACYSSQTGWHDCLCEILDILLLFNYLCKRLHALHRLGTSGLMGDNAWSLMLAASRRGCLNNQIVIRLSYRQLL